MKQHIDLCVGRSSNSTSNSTEQKTIPELFSNYNSHQSAINEDSNKEKETKLMEMFPGLFIE